MDRQAALDETEAEMEKLREEALGHALYVASNLNTNNQDAATQGLGDQRAREGSKRLSHALEKLHRLEVEAHEHAACLKS